MYGRNLLHTFSNVTSRINPANVANLQLLWTFPTTDAVSASPTVVDDVIYVGSWECALKARIISGGGFHPDNCR
jgi:hypothetical protein